MVLKIKEFANDAKKNHHLSANIQNVKHYCILKSTCRLRFFNENIGHTLSK